MLINNCMNQKDSNNVKSALDVIRRISADSDARAQLEILQQLVGASQGIVAAARKLSAPKPKSKAKKSSAPKIRPRKLTLPSERNPPPKEPAKEPVKALPPPTSTTTQPVQPIRPVAPLSNQQSDSEKP
jgi:hypothetical protein